jgi:hypothetical protein
MLSAVCKSSNYLCEVDSLTNVHRDNNTDLNLFVSEMSCATKDCRTLDSAGVRIIGVEREAWTVPSRYMSTALRMQARATYDANRLNMRAYQPLVCEKCKSHYLSSVQSNETFISFDPAGEGRVNLISWREALESSINQYFVLLFVNPSPDISPPSSAYVVMGQNSGNFGTSYGYAEARVCAIDAVCTEATLSMSSADGFATVNYVLEKDVQTSFQTNQLIQ